MLLDSFSVDWNECLPSHLQNYLQLPTALCECGVGIFQVAFLAVYEGENQFKDDVKVHYFLGLFCTLKCVHKMEEEMVRLKRLNKANWKLCTWTIRQYNTWREGAVAFR